MIYQYLLYCDNLPDTFLHLILLSIKHLMKNESELLEVPAPTFNILSDAWKFKAMSSFMLG